MNKTDIQLKQDIEDELRWDPKLNAAQIGVVVDMGAVSLLGAVDTYAEKLAAEEATKRVSGVRTVAQDLTVKVLTDHERTDPDIATAIETTFRWDVSVPKTVTATVRDASVTLAGTVISNHEREAAERAIRYLTGVVAVHNEIRITPEASTEKVLEKVRAALHRQATADGKTIHVEATGGKVTLTGHASSWQSIEDAANAAWAAPGVTEVVDHVKMTMSFKTP